MLAWFRSMLRGAVALVAVCLLLRTWVVMGLIVPMAVSGSSMAPGLKGLHYHSICQRCGKGAYRSAESGQATERSACPACGEAGSLVSGRPLPADRVWVNRLARPERWDTVVAHEPGERGLCVKRLVGLPGEEVSLEYGDLMIDGRVARKSLQEQRAVRVRIAAQPAPQEGVVFTPVGQEVFTDDLPYNATLTRRLNPVADLMVSTTVTPGDETHVSVTIGRAVFSLDGAGSAQVDTDGAVLRSAGRRLPTRPFLLELSTFDRQALLAVDGEEWVSGPLPRLDPIEQVEASIAGEGSLLTETTLWRDAYYEPALGAPRRSWGLGPGEVFLLGDNAPVSLDSRRWGPVRRNSILGRLLGGH